MTNYTRIMRFKNTIILGAAAVLITSCLGDKKLANVDEIGNTSFVNEDFDSNLINYQPGMSACANISAADIAQLYGVAANQVHVEDPTQSDRYQKGMEPMCRFYLEVGESDHFWPRGSIALQREVSADETMGEIAEAVGSGENWQEAWSLKKATSESSEWIPNMGQAALWNERKTTLEIKFDGYTLIVNPLTNPLNEEYTRVNRDYKKITIAMAKAGGYIN